MLKLPVAIGLKMCQQVVIEETTRHVTLVNRLRRLVVESFPSAAKELVVCAILTDGLSEMDLTLEIASLVSMDSVHSFTWKIKLGEALRETWCHLKLNRVAFPENGRYQVSLLANREFVAQMTLDVVSKGEVS